MQGWPRKQALVLPRAYGDGRRCDSLNKTCSPSPPVRRRQVLAKATARGSKVGQLEEKVNGLVALLQSSPSAARRDLNSSPDKLYVENDSDPLPDSTSVVDTSGFAPRRSPDISTGQDTLEVVNQSINPADAESFYGRFRSDFVHYFPFVVIAPSVTAVQLRQQYPLLWLCIMTVASTDTGQQLFLSKNVRETLVREVYVVGTRNLDLLLAILVYIAW